MSQVRQSYLPAHRVKGKAKSEEVAKLWMNENSIVNQKAAYFTAVNGGLLVAMKDQASADLIYLTLWVGVAVCVIAFLSISRTCAYRAKLRGVLDARPDYGPLLEVSFRWWERLQSNVLLPTVPLLAIPGWVYVACTKLGIVLP